MSEKNKIFVIKHKSNKQNILKQSTSNNNTSKGNSEELRDRSGGTKNKQNNVDDKHIHDFEKHEEYESSQIQIRDLHISDSRKHYKQETREASMKKKHDAVRVDKAEVVFEYDETGYTSKILGGDSNDRFHDHEKEEINKKRYTSDTAEENQIGSSTNKMKISKPITDIDESKKYDENVAKSTIKENENEHQIATPASRTKSKYTDSSDRAINNESSETPKNIHNHNTTDDKNDHNDSYVIHSKTKEPHNTGNTQRTNTTHLDVLVVKSKNETNYKKHQLTKATVSDMTKSVDDDKRTYYEPSTTGMIKSNLKTSDMNKNDKNDTIHPSNITETYQIKNMESEPETVRVKHDRKSMNGQKKEISVEIDNLQTKNYKPIDSCQTNIGYPVNNASNRMVLSKAVNISSNRESDISNKTDSSVTNNPQSLDQNDSHRYNKYNNIQSKSKFNSQLTDIKGENKEKLKSYDEKSMSKTEIEVDKNTIKGISYISQNNASPVNEKFSVGNLQDNNIIRTNNVTGTTSNSVDIKRQEPIFQQPGLNKDDRNSSKILPKRESKELYQSHNSQISSDATSTNKTRDRYKERKIQNDSFLGLKGGFTNKSSESDAYTLDGNGKYKGDDLQKVSFLQSTLAETSSNEMITSKVTYSKYHVNNLQNSSFHTANTSDISSDLLNTNNVQQNKYKGQGHGYDSHRSGSFREQNLSRREENLLRKKYYSVASIEDTVKATNSASNVSGSCPYDIPVLYSAIGKTTISADYSKPQPTKTGHALESATVKRKSIYDALHGDNNHFY
ncbi:unnamed protein product [Mytilus coruscus]|uniref:Uncharacterized protein n=1 Tax=Mytilus coruscus TaxID=42192 RepID=A0A6J8E1A1_MYTCO|nr:unnamed protein product [Mytilus coruscus]